MGSSRQRGGVTIEGDGSYTTDAALSWRQLSALRQKDPNFDPVRFRQQVVVAYTVYHTMRIRDATALISLLSPRLYQRLRTEAPTSPESGAIVTNLKFSSPGLLSVVTGTKEDKILMTCSGYAGDYQMDPETGEVNFGAGPHLSIDELWLFGRDRTRYPNTLPPPASCSACGGVDPVDDRGLCRFCGAWLLVGPPGWLVIDITPGTVLPAAFEHAA